MSKLIIHNNTKRPLDEILKHVRNLLMKNRAAGLDTDDLSRAVFSDGVTITSTERNETTTFILTEAD